MLSTLPSIQSYVKRKCFKILYKTNITIYQFVAHTTIIRCHANIENIFDEVGLDRHAMRNHTCCMNAISSKGIVTQVLSDIISEDDTISITAIMYNASEYHHDYKRVTNLEKINPTMITYMDTSTTSFAEKQNASKHGRPLLTVSVRHALVLGAGYLLTSVLTYLHEHLQ